MVIILALSIFLTPEQRVYGAKTAACIQFSADAFLGEEEDIPAKFFIANPAQKTVKPFPKDRQPHAFAGKSGALSPNGHYIAQIQADRNDDQKIVLVMEDRQVAKVSAIKSFRLINSPKMVWANDSKQLAVSWHENDDTYLIIVNADGSQSRSIPLKAADGSSIPSILLSWSADSQYLATQYSPTIKPDQNLALFFRSSDLQPTPNSPYPLSSMQLVWSPQGHRFATWSMNDFTMASVEGDFKQHFRSEITDQDSELKWSPDGQYAALLWGQRMGQQTIHFYGADGTSLLNIRGPVLYRGIEGPLYRPDAQWSPDSRYFTFSRRITSDIMSSDNARQFDLWSVDIKSRTIKILTPLLGTGYIPGGISHNPNETRIAVPISQGNHGEQTALLLTNVDGGNQVTLKTKAITKAGIPEISWSPDSKYVAFITDRDTLDFISPSPIPRLTWAKADGSGESSLTAENLMIIGWETNKNLLIYMIGKGDDNKVMALNLATGRSYALTQSLSKLLYKNTATAVFGRWTFFSGPARRFVVMTAVVDFADAGPGGPGEGSSTNVYLAAWDGSVAKTLDNSDYSGPSSVIWSPDGMMFAYTYRNTIAIYTYDGNLLWTADAAQNPDDVNLDSLLWVPCEE